MAERFIIVLDDGSTYTVPAGCKLIYLTAEGADHLEENGDAKFIEESEIISEVDLGDLCEYLPDDFFPEEEPEESDDE